MKPINELAKPVGTQTSFNPWWICAVCFCVMAVDGFDTAAIAYVAPSLTQLWHLSRAAMSPAFVATSAGAVLGYLASGAIVRTIPRRTVILLAMLSFGGFTLLTVISSGIAVISVIRFLTTICLGMVVPAAISIAADSAPDHARASATIAATTGLSVGAAIGGLGSPKLITGYGWEAVFIAGGLIPVLLLPLVWYVLPRNQEQAGATGVAHRVTDNSSWFREIKSLFAPDLLSTTVTVWLVAFFGFLVNYLFVFWTPMLLLSFRFSPSSAPLGAAAAALGGIAGNLLLFTLARRMGVPRSLIVTTSIAMLSVVGFQIGGLDRWAVLLFIFGVGVGATTACVGQSALATVLYPAALRTTSVGNAAAIGRLGAIIGPSAGGILIALGISAQHIVLLSCIPLSIVAIVLLISQMWTAGKRKAPELRGF
ncbi:MFS transporter [Paraburkholderia sediminicola]|uniref:MFS transporter n=1 Tax=Paraburkholderia sediminicola TaxID=458836 RepID=UPI0038BA97FF